MYIRIRNLDESIVKKIDSMAKRNSLSRTEFLKKSLEKLIVSDEISELDSRFNNLLKRNISVLDSNTKALKVFCEENLIDISDL